MSWQMTLDELLQGTGGELVSRHATTFTGVGTDTRVNLQGQIFVALKGDNFDAHDFLSAAVEKGAAVLLVHQLPPSAAGLDKKVTIVKVEDTLKGLQRLGNFWRHKSKAHILGVTGTNGKTTTKEFTAAVLGTKFKVQYSKGSFNNHWGVPISLLSIEPEHQVAVIEMGMNHPGELTTLVDIAEPETVLCTMVGRGHLEGVGSIEGAAKAKEEIYLHSKPGVTRVFNLDNPYTKKMYERATQTPGLGRIVTFGSQGGTNVSLQMVCADESSLTIRGTIGGVFGQATVPVFGVHNVANLMAASAFALTVGMSGEEIWSALPQCRSGWGRNQWVQLQSGARVLFDGYNANPESMRAAVENFGRLTSKGKKVGIFGEMREMGPAAPDVHRELGMVVGNSNFDVVCFVGPSHDAFWAGLKAARFEKKLFISDAYEQSLAQQIGSVIDKDDIIVIKGSRGMQMERFVADWKPLDFTKK